LAGRSLDSGVPFGLPHRGEIISWPERIPAGGLAECLADGVYRLGALLADGGTDLHPKLGPRGGVPDEKSTKRPGGRSDTSPYPARDLLTDLTRGGFKNPGSQVRAPQA
jgi:hypothetical protein